MDGLDLVDWNAKSIPISNKQTKEQPSHNDCHSHTHFVMEMEIEVWNDRIIGNSSLKTRTSNQP